jgi:hypothetical protein
MLIFIPQMCIKVYGNEKSEYFLQIHFKPKNLHFWNFYLENCEQNWMNFMLTKKSGQNINSNP